MKVRLTAEAEHDLESIADWIALDDRERALGFIRELRDCCLGLASFPERFPLVPRYERHGIRHRVHGNYMIFYRVDDVEVIIIHVLHGAMDYGELLAG